MKKLFVLSAILLSGVAFSNAHADNEIPCGSQIRAKIAEVVRHSPEFRNEDPGHAIGIFSIDLSSDPDGSVDAIVAYGSARQGPDGSAEMELTASPGRSCDDIVVKKVQE